MLLLERGRIFLEQGIGYEAVPDVPAYFHFSKGRFIIIRINDRASMKRAVVRRSHDNDNAGFDDALSRCAYYPITGSGRLP